ncbi:MAG TPA: xanthine dehydrogenase family protein molybdopterin-binding subunit [Aliidongia sp.]|nr:xanthine dehydrogenase family protein molybdopterin-binding subunit [Aliidongia sp.]
MTPPDDMIDWATQKFAVGQPVTRNEDPMLLRGEGSYTDDLNLPGQAYAVIIRSPHAHGVIRALHVEAAREAPGVLGIYTAADFAEKGYGAFKCIMALASRDGTPMHMPPRFSLAEGKVRYVGEPVAFVVAETAAEARDAADLVELDIDALPAVTGLPEAAAPGAPLLYDDLGTNVAVDFHIGHAEQVAAAFAQAAHVTKLRLVNNRIVVCAMEPRAAIAEYDAEEAHFTLRLGCQGAFGLRNGLADIMRVEQKQMRVLTGNVGGSFGMKASAYPEYICLLHAARALGRPVKWTDERSGSFLSDQHGRSSEVEASLALDKDGKFLAVRVTGFGDLGAGHTSVGPLMPTMGIMRNIVSVYRTPLVEVAVKCVFTNTTPVGAYRGAGRPEGNYYMERLIDAAADETGIDKVELRRLNHIRPGELPYKTPAGTHYDSGEFTALLDEALARADWAGFPARRRESEAKGKLRGIGIGSFLEVTAPGTKELGRLRFEPDGAVTIITGTLDYGQGHWTPFAQVLSQKLGIPFDKIRLLQGDSDELIAGGGTGGSRSIMASGSAIIGAGDEVIKRGTEIAAHVLEAAPADIEFRAGQFTIAGTDRGIGLLDLAKQLRAGIDLPPELPRSLDVEHVGGEVPSTYPNGCHIAEVEIDPETGTVALQSYSTVNDFGTLVNPLLVEGQAHGGIVQGIGQALMEQTVYDESGQLLAGSFMDYALPRAGDLPALTFHSRPAPATTNPLGVKGCGEAGCAGALPAVMNAVVDALKARGVKHIDMPATPARVWAALNGAEGA